MQMSPKAKNAVAVHSRLDSDSDEDDGGGRRRGFRSLSLLICTPQVSSMVGDAIEAPRETLECRSFWKAGDNFTIPSVVTPTAPGMLEPARVHPKFLHSNATSHKWAFGAIAELLDNAVDEIQNGATFVKVDKIDLAKDNSPALVFQDDGGGMDPDGMRKCMSLGYSSKKSNTTIGQYGNGFKTSTMRLGADAIVFSRSTREGKITQSIGLLSYTFLRKTGQDDVIVPMIDIFISKESPEPIIYGSADDWAANLEIILKWSPFSTEEELSQQFDDMATHGTKVIIYNLWHNDEGLYELSFDDDDEDIRLRDESVDDGKGLRPKKSKLKSHISYRLRYSLRAYVSMLYLKKFKKFKIILRGIPVEQFNIADELRYVEIAKYKPNAAGVELSATETKVGFIKEAPKLAVYGFNVYHKNRLILPFWKVVSETSTRGLGVVGVLEANFIQPAHDKQDFERSALFQRLEKKLRRIFRDYWSNHCHVFGYYSRKTPVVDKSKRKPVPDKPKTIDTTSSPSPSPSPLPSPAVKSSKKRGRIIHSPAVKSRQGGWTIRKISRKNTTSIRKNITSIRTVSATPTQLRYSPGLGYNIQPVQLSPQPPAITHISELGLSDPTSSRRVSVAPPHLRNSPCLKYNAEPEQLTPQPVVATSVIEISEENIQVSCNATPSHPVSVSPQHLSNSTGLGYNIQPVQLTPQPADTNQRSDISRSDATSSRRVSVAPPHLRNSSGLKHNVQPQQLTPQPVVATDNTGDNLVEINEENIQLSSITTPSHPVSVAPQHLSNSTGLSYNIQPVRLTPQPVTTNQISEIGLVDATSSRRVSVAPPHLRKSSGLKHNVQPSQLTPQPVLAIDNTGDNLVGMSLVEINEENIQLSSISTPSHHVSVSPQHLSNPTGLSYNIQPVQLTPQPVATNQRSEISVNDPTSSRRVSVAPPHFLRNSSSLKYNAQPVQLNPQPVVATDTGENLVSKSVVEISEENIQLSCNATPSHPVSVSPQHLSNIQPMQLTLEPAVATDNTGDDLVGKSVVEISEENIQLFMRCEEYIHKEIELEQIVKNLEKELEDYRSKCAQLALLVDTRRKEMQQGLV